METETWQLKDGRRVKVYPSDNDDNPREWDTATIMLCSHSRYSLGDKQLKDVIDMDVTESWNDIRYEVLQKYPDVLAIRPLYLYDHSGITIKTSPFGCRWDSGQVGFIVVTKSSMIEQGWNKKDCTKEKAEEIIGWDVKAYDQFLTGDVYQFTLYKIETCDLGHEHEIELDSCGGFFGRDWKENGMLDHIGIKESDIKERN